VVDRPDELVLPKKSFWVALNSPPPRLPRQGGGVMHCHQNSPPLAEGLGEGKETSTVKRTRGTPSGFATFLEM